MFSRSLVAALIVAAATQAAAFAPSPLMKLSAHKALPLSSTSRARSATCIKMTSEMSRRSALAGIAAGAFTVFNPMRTEADVGGFKASEFIPREGGQYESVAVPEGYTGPLPKASTKPEEAISIILKNMYTNDKPSENYGLKTAIAFTSSANPFAKMPITKFRSIMDGSSYKVLFGGYDRFENVVIVGDDPNEIVVDSKLYAPVEKLQQTIKKDKYINTKGPEPYAVCRWKLSRGEGTGNAWLFDTVYFLNQIDPNGF